MGLALQVNALYKMKAKDLAEPGQLKREASELASDSSSCTDIQPLTTNPFRLSIT